MNLDELENKAVKKYLKNMEFFKEHSPVLHKKLEVLEEGINSGLILEKYRLELKNNNYFDIYDVEKNSWFYGENSSEYSKKIIKNIDLDLETSSFKTFQEFHYEEGVLEKLKNASITSSTVFGNAPIVDYVNNNILDKRISKQIFCYMIFGVGLGLHIPLIQQSVNAKLYCIIEPNLEIFRLSLFIISYNLMAEKSQLIFFVSTEKELFSFKFRDFHDQAYLYNQYLKFFLFSQNCEVYFEGIQSMLASQSHNMFGYDRELLSLEKTANFVHDKFKFLKINQREDLKDIKDLPLLILAGGPSLKKNLDFVRENQSKFIILSIFSLCAFLEENGIYPDIFTNYDEDENAFIDIYNNIKNKKSFAETVFLFSSHVSRRLIEQFPKENVYLYNALFSLKKNNGVITAPSIGEISYALGLILNFESIYLLGLDLAFDQETGKSHFEGYNEMSQFEVNRDASIEKFSFRKNVMKVKGNLQNSIETSAVFYISIKQLNLFTKYYNPDKKIKVYNLSDGAYFDDITPLEIKKFDFSNFKNLDKKELLLSIQNNFDEISSNEFTEEDKESILGKLNDAKQLKKDLKKLFLDSKHATIEKYLICLEDFDDILKLKKYKCGELMRIIRNFSRHNLPYLFFFFSLKNLNNPKTHIKKLNKLFFNQILKIIDYYINILERVIKEKIK